MIRLKVPPIQIPPVYVIPVASTMYLSYPAAGVAPSYISSREVAKTLEQMKDWAHNTRRSTRLLLVPKHIIQPGPLIISVSESPRMQILCITSYPDSPPDGKQEAY